MILGDESFALQCFKVSCIQRGKHNMLNSSLQLCYVQYNIIVTRVKVFSTEICVEYIILGFNKLLRYSTQISVDYFKAHY